MIADVELLITDLDNTLYDWVTYFATSFYAMVDVAVDILRVDRERLLDDCRTVHQLHHNSEQPFAILETDAVKQAFSGADRKTCYERLKPAFDAFERARDRTLVVYPGVLETLRQIRRCGAEVVAHTEATSINARFRIATLGLGEDIGRLYALEDRGEGHPDLENARPLARVQFRKVRQDERKPYARVLLDICADATVPPSKALYVGDSLPNDIGMANEAGVWSAWARYGTRYRRDDWAKLVRVTHWTTRDVERAEETRRKHADAKPDIILEDGFGEILSAFRFTAA